jgi:Zn-dependent M28 family amino/carboxypeptidase
MGAHMDIAPPGGPPGGGTYEGAYDNTAGTVSMMLFARAFADLTFECDTFLALWSSEEEGLRGSSAFANNNCDYCLPQDKELEFYINMDMMGMSWPAHKSNGDPFPYHAWSGPDADPAVQDVEISTILDDVHFDILKAPRDLRIDGSFGAGCDQHWDEHSDLVMDVHEDTFGRSDHVTFRNLGAQTIFHLGAYDADYSAYHSPSDTLDNMVTEVGGQEELEKSMEFVMWAAMLEFIIADQSPEIRNLNA